MEKTKYKNIIYYKNSILPLLSRKKAAQERKAERKRERDGASYQTQTSDPRVVKAASTKKN